MLRFDAGQLRPFGCAIMKAAGVPQEPAELVVDHALAALLSGEQGHGVELGTQYLPAIEDGTIRPNADMEVVRESPTTLLVDGQMNLGHLVSHRVMKLLIAKASTQNVAAASIRYQAHVGRLIDYTAMAADAGMIALMMCDGAWGPKFVAPFGGVSRRLGLNPWSLALPSDRDGTVGFDMTSGATSLTKVLRARELNEQVPEGWVLDRLGSPSTDPEDFWRGGSILPHGGAQAHKGYALAFMIEVLADVLSGMEFREEPDRPSPIVDGCFMALFSVEAFRPLAEFKTDLGHLIDYVKSSPAAPGSAGVYYPGERSANNRARARREGVQIPASAWSKVTARADRYGVGHLAPAPLT